MCDTFQVSKEGGVHLLASPQLPPKSLCQGSLALCSQTQTVKSVARPGQLMESTKTRDSVKGGGGGGGGGRGDNGGEGLVWG